MNRIKRYIAIGAFSLLVLALPAIASAQNRDRDDDRYGNGGYNNGQYGNGGYNNGQYGNGQYGNNGDMRSTLRDLKNHARLLERQIDRELDRSRYNGSNREDQVNRLASRFKDAVNDMDSSYNSRNDRETRRVTELASQLDRVISRSGLSYQVQNHWAAIRRDLQVLGVGYGYNNNNRNSRNNRYPQNGNNYPQNGNNRVTKPSWWPF